MSKLFLISALLLLSGCNKAPSAEEQPNTKNSEFMEKAKARYNQWAYVAKEKQIAAGETLKLVIIPNSLGFEILDTNCLIYTNAEYKQSTMICPGATQEDIKQVEQ